MLAADDVAKLLKEVGVSADKDSLALMISKVQGKPIHEIIAAGQEKFAQMPSSKPFLLTLTGGPAPVAAAAGTAAPAKELKPVEPEQEVDLGGMNMFGDEEY